MTMSMLLLLHVVVFGACLTGGSCCISQATRPLHMPPMVPRNALFIRNEWCEKIFNEEKTWELRSYPLPDSKKGETVAVACSKKNVLVGTVRLAGCLRVGEKKDGVWQPASTSEKHLRNFFLNPVNSKKIGFGKDKIPGVIKGYQSMYAWRLKDVKKIDKPKPWRPPRGAVVFAKITVPEDEPVSGSGSS